MPGRASFAAVIAPLALAIGCGAPIDEASAELATEAGFVEIEPVEYTLHGASGSYLATSSRARLFYSFHPANEGSGERPLVVAYSGGPGASSAILFGGNTAPMTVDPERVIGGSVGENPSSWTAFANVLYVDARGAGLSYGVVPGAADATVREAEFTERNWNPYLDAADVVRVVLRFLGDHPSLSGRRVVLAGESYGGMRTEIALHLLRFPDRYEQGSSPYVDTALAAEIRAHFAKSGTTAPGQFDRAVLLQPRLTSPEQQAAAGESLDGPGSPIAAIEPSQPYFPCAQQGDTCAPYPNVVEYLKQIGRDIYDIRRPEGSELGRYAAMGERLADPQALGAVLGVDLGSIEGLSAGERGDAYRLFTVDPTPEALEAPLGELPDHDRYFEMSLFDLLGKPFVSGELQALGLDRTDSRYGRLFLEDLLDTKVLITNAAFDAAIWTPSLPEALARYTDLVAGVERGDEAFTIEYVEGAFGAPKGAKRAVTFPTYATSGHSIALDQPSDLADDVAAFLLATE